MRIVICSGPGTGGFLELPPSLVGEDRPFVSGGERSLYELAVGAACLGLDVELRGSINYPVLRRLTDAAGATPRLRLEPRRPDPSDIVVIPEAAAPSLSRRSEHEVEAVRSRFELPDEYLLWVGGLRVPEPRKRVAALARATRTMPLVLVGAAGRWAHELPNVKLTGEVSDDELAAIYTGAHALIFPSDDEGFGLPPVEALACGTPVVACDVPALRESLGDRASWVAVDDLEGLLAAAEAAERPAPPPLRWTWADAAAATWQVYADAAGAERAPLNASTWR